MRHRKKGKLSRGSKSYRKSLLKNLAKCFFMHEKIITTESKAKYLKSYIERLINIGKNSDLSSRKSLIKKLNDKLIANKIIENISPKYKERKGGYTRLIKLSKRVGDNAKLVRIELV